MSAVMGALALKQSMRQCSWDDSSALDHMGHRRAVPGLKRTMARRQPSSVLSICMSRILDTSSVSTLKEKAGAKVHIRHVFFKVPPRKTHGTLVMPRVDRRPLHALGLALVIGRKHCCNPTVLWRMGSSTPPGLSRNLGPEEGPQDG